MPQGFTLLELIITLTIISIILAFGLPSMDAFLTRTNNELLQSTLTQAISFAKQAAPAKASQIALCPSQNHQLCSSDYRANSLLIFKDSFNDGLIHHRDQLLAVMDFPAKAKLYCRSFPYYRHYVLFWPTPLMSNDNAAFWYCREKSSNPEWAIMLSKTGRTRVVDADKEGRIRDHKGNVLSCK